MSGRIRTVKPEWLEDELLALCSSDARVLSIALVLLADDHGRGRANKIMLAGQVFAGKPLETLANALEELRAIRYVVTYEVEGQNYFWIRNWSKHQKVDHPSLPRLPAPPAELTGNIVSLAPPLESLGEPRETLANTRASRGSEVQVQVAGTGTGPDPGPARGLVPVRKPTPTNQADALALPLAERARLVLEDPGNGSWSSPQTWPEVVMVAESLAKAAGHKRPKLGDCQRDAGVRIVLGHFADGWDRDELVALAAVVGRSRWWRDGGPARGLSSMTAEVLRRYQNEKPKQNEQMDPEIAKEIAKTRRMAAEVGNGGT